MFWVIDNILMQSVGCLTLVVRALNKCRPSASNNNTGNQNSTDQNNPRQQRSAAGRKNTRVRINSRVESTNTISNNENSQQQFIVASSDEEEPPPYGDGNYNTNNNIGSTTPTRPSFLQLQNSDEELTQLVGHPHHHPRIVGHTPIRELSSPVFNRISAGIDSACDSMRNVFDAISVHQHEHSRLEDDVEEVFHTPNQSDLNNEV